MSYWVELLHWPPSQIELVVFTLTALFFTRFKEHLKLHQSAFLAFVVYLVVISALPHLTDKGMFSFHDFGESFFSSSLGQILSRYVGFYLCISILRKISKRYLPKKLFFKN